MSKPTRMGEIPIPWEDLPSTTWNTRPPSYWSGYRRPLKACAATEGRKPSPRRLRRRRARGLPSLGTLLAVLIAVVFAYLLVTGRLDGTGIGR